MNPPIELTAEKIQSLADSSKALTEWLEQGRILATAESARQFEVGDWIAAGADKWDKKAYKDATTIFAGYSRATLHTFAHVSRRVPALLRNKDLSWAHHKVVARFSEPEYQASLLAHAATRNLPLSKFREYVESKQPSPKAAKSTKAILIRLEEEDLIWLKVVAFRADKCSLAEAVNLIVHDYHARCKSVFEHVPYAPAHPSLVNFFGSPEAYEKSKTDSTT